MKQKRVNGWQLLLACGTLFGPWFHLPAASQPGAPDGERWIEGITFDDVPGTLYAPVRELGEVLGLPVEWEKQTGRTLLDGKEISPSDLRPMPNGEQVLAVRALGAWDATIGWEEELSTARIHRDGRQVRVHWGEKRVAVSLNRQRLRAWQGDRLVLDTRISSGRPGHGTPRGRFHAGPLKSELLISRRYGNARMPWSVQVRGHVVIHGFRSVPPRAASHGCIRMPLTGSNPARWFYQWVAVGTPIRIANRWPT